MGQQVDSQDAITLEEMTGSLSGEVIFGIQDNTNLLAPRRSSTLTMTDQGLVDQERPSQPVNPPNDGSPGSRSTGLRRRRSGRAGSCSRWLTASSPPHEAAAWLSRSNCRATGSQHQATRFLAENADVMELASAGPGSQR